MTKWRKNREITFDFIHGKIRFGSNEQYYQERMRKLIDQEDYEGCIKLRVEAQLNGVDIGLPLPPAS